MRYVVRRRQYRLITDSSFVGLSALALRYRPSATGAPRFNALGMRHFDLDKQASVIGPRTRSTICSARRSRALYRWRTSCRSR
jgi:hypothetical protein